MARAIERIERDIAALEEALSVLAAELGNAYTAYLAALGQAIRQHLILASYYLCTQGYPEPFLSLSFGQRQQLQQAIRKLGQKASDQLLACIGTGEDLGASNPSELADWQQNLEGAIALILKTSSLDTNYLLQQVGILPQNLPEPLLEVAAKADASNEATTGPPNLLNLLVETRNDESEAVAMTHIIAIQLRLSEIEFADVTVRAGRNQIRNLLLKANALGQEHQKKQRERAVAQAEAAWRASWFEE